jgi:DNA-binding NarL/FixJ family response regulator
LRRIIDHEEDLLVCAEADGARSARFAIRQTIPDAVVIDISLDHDDGIELVRDVRAHYPQLPILVFSMHDEAIYAERLLSVGANGYMTKQACGEQFLLSLRRVLDGGIYVSDVVAHNMLRRASARGGPIPADPIDRLSNRELQVLRSLGKGMSTRETAQSLNVSDKTIESHRQRMKAKLHLRSGAQLVQFAINWSVTKIPAQARELRSS